MIAALLILFFGLAGIAAILAGRTYAARRWARDLEAFRLLLPSGLDPDAVARFLGMLAAITSASRWVLRPPSALAIEIRANARQGIQHFVLVPHFARTAVLQSIRAGLPGARLEPAPDYLAKSTRLSHARELTLTTTLRPLAVEHGEAVATAFLMALQPLQGTDELRAAVYFAGAGTPRLIRSPRRQAPDRPLSWLDSGADADTEALRARRAKDKDPQLLVCIRVGATSSSARTARALVRQVVATLRGMNAPGVSITQRAVPSNVVARRMVRRALPLTTWMLLGTTELAGLIGLPIGDSHIPGLHLGTSRLLPPSPTAPHRGVVLARSNYPGSEDRLIRLGSTSRASHVWLLGPTGVGKSTLIANMALQDATAGHGFVVVDPKSDLVTDVLARLPESRLSDVIVLDAAAAFADDGRPIVGLNVLGQARTEQERELAADQVVYILHSIWEDSWGPRTADVLRNAILTLTHTRAADNSVFTLSEIAPLLEQAAYRRFVTAQASIPESVRSFWTAYESYSDAQRLQIIGPSLNKLRALSTRTALRLTLGQSVGLDIGDVLNHGKILLVPLSKGIVGSETAALLGSLVVAQLVNAVFARTALPADQRRPAQVYLDEFQEVVRLATDIPDALAQARGLGVGFVLANQYVHQLPDAAKRAVLGTVRSAVVFALQDYDDAKLLERRFAPLAANELMRLPPYEIAAVLSDSSAVSSPVTGITLPLPDAEHDPAELLRSSAERYGMARSDIEAALRARLVPPARRAEPAEHDKQQSPSAPTFGRRKLGSGQ